MDEELNNNYEEMEDIEAVEVDEETETSRNGIVGKLIVGAVVAVAAGAGALIYKNRAKLREIQIRNLEKKGYIVSRPDEDACVDDNVEYVDDYTD